MCSNLLARRRETEVGWEIPSLPKPDVKFSRGFYFLFVYLYYLGLLLFFIHKFILSPSIFTLRQLCLARLPSSVLIFCVFVEHILSESFHPASTSRISLFNEVYISCQPQMNSNLISGTPFSILFPPPNIHPICQPVFMCAANATDRNVVQRRQRVVKYVCRDATGGRAPVKEWCGITCMCWGGGEWLLNCVFAIT